MKSPDDPYYPPLVEPSEHDIGLDDPRIDGWMARDEKPSVDERVWVRLWPEDVPARVLDVRRKAPGMSRSPSATPASVTDPASLPVVLTIDEAAVLLRTTTAALYARVERGLAVGLVPGQGRRILFSRDQLVASINGRNGRTS